jgi:hypothetical protein
MTMEPEMNGTDDAKVILRAGGSSIPNPTEADIERALAGPRDDDWIVTLDHGDDDFMEVMLDRGGVWVECEFEGRFLQAKSYVDDAALRSMFLAFRDGNPAWRDLAAWKEPEKAAPRPPPPIVVNAATFIGVVVLGCLGATFATATAAGSSSCSRSSFPGSSGSPPR